MKGKKGFQKGKDNPSFGGGEKISNYIPTEIRICECGCEQTFECKINSKQRFIHGHNRRNAVVSGETKDKSSKAALNRKDPSAGWKGHKPGCNCNPCKAIRGETKGENNSNWKGGVSKQMYPEEFDKKLKTYIRERDNNTCQLCGRIKEEKGENLCIHHIDYNKKNCSFENLITLCRPCHTKTNNSRKIWKLRLKQKLKNPLKKLLILGDLHLTRRSPTRRNDKDYLGTIINKLNQARIIAEKENCDLVIQVGDFFDSPRVSNSTIVRVMQILQKLQFPIFVIAGQHDFFGHSIGTLPNSPLNVLISAETVNFLNDNPFVFDKEKATVNLYGASYGESIPEPENEKNYNILVLHRMIGDRELFPGQELEKPNQFLRNNPKFQLVIVGDYHYRFSSQYQGRTIINAGCLVRKTISKWDLEHKPSVAIFNTETSEVKFIELDVRPVEEVFDLNRETKVGKACTEKFLQSLKESLSEKNEGKGVNWKNILSTVIEEKDCSEEVRNIIDGCLEEVR